MFTGIIEAIGELQEVAPREGGVRITVAAAGLDLSDLKLGDSIAVNGVCLTVIEHKEVSFKADVSDESLRCTTGLQRPGPVNLEKALRLADRLGGHLVSGHVDGIGRVVRFDRLGESFRLDIDVPEGLSRYIAAKGSICVNGVSLTTNTSEVTRFSVNLIPHTLSVTTLGTLSVGDSVNIEVDLIARYVERIHRTDRQGIYGSQ